MFSPRSLAIFALIATAVALPASDKSIPKPITTITNDEFVPVMPAPWFSVPYFGDITKLFAPMWKLFPNFEDLGPRIVVDDDKLEVIVPVKEYSKSDLKVKVKGDFILLQGSHEAKQDDHDLFASQFSHTYTLPANSSAAAVTAELTSDGYLIVKAPAAGSVDRSKETDRDVPIVETGAPLKKEISQTPVAEDPVAPEGTVADEIPQSNTAEPEIVSEEDRKEPTTPHTDREEATENDNVIPHGNNLKL